MNQGVIPRRLDKRVLAMCEAPRMWGSLQAVELQVLLCSEMLLWQTQPGLDSRCVREHYQRHIKALYPGRGNHPLSVLAPDEKIFVVQLHGFWARMQHLARTGEWPKDKTNGEARKQSAAIAVSKE